VLPDDLDSAETTACRALDGGGILSLLQEMNTTPEITSEATVSSTRFFMMQD
jgi:hypothetical protein